MWKSWLADLCGLAFAPFDIPVAAVDERQAATIEGARGAVRLALAPGGRTERVLTVLSAAAGVQVVLAGVHANECLLRRPFAARALSQAPRPAPRAPP